ncbi:MAG: D-glycero-beta-D-manno-heptose-7-phosphate kinase [Flavobacteriia bacterium]|nr:D-glycero-beta-D-manno-heptose-7-phosphate kinase [Flavobacteriia bacterium]
MNFKEIVDSFNSKRVLVIGDVMIDAYLRGNVNRVSPEAPVPIVSLEKEEERLGGAANVAINLVAMGASAIVCSVIGNDKSGKKMVELLELNNISAAGVILSNNRETTVKTRVIGNNQHLIRIDSEQTNDLDETEQTALIEKVKELLEGNVDAVIFEDYNKGVLTENVIRKIISIAQRKNIPTTVDPKNKNFFAYEGVTLFKPNLKELKEGVGLKFSFTEIDLFEKAVSILEEKLKNSISFITLSEHGVFIKEDLEKYYIPAHIRNIADVSGAGDTVISVATLCLAVGLPIHLIAEIANLAGGLVCEKSGVVSIDKEQLIEEVEKMIIK